MLFLDIGLSAFKGFCIEYLIFCSGKVSNVIYYDYNVFLKGLRGIFR